jgi:type II secretory pathway pseudopilin PulG
VLAVIAVIAALAAVAVLATFLLTRDDAAKASQEDMVRSTIQSFDAAVQTGDLAALRGITCGQTKDSYVKYDDRAWSDTHARVAAARQYPVVASIDEVVVNGDHAEANVTSFMAFDPATRSTRSFDLQFRDNQWKICQAS